MTILILALSAILNSMSTSWATITQDHSVYPDDIYCLKDDSTGSLAQYMKHLGTELEDYISGSSTKNYDDKANCSDKIMNINTNLDLFANVFSGNVELNYSIETYFSKIFELLVRPSSLVLLFSIVGTGIVLNSIKKLKKNTDTVRKGFSQGTRDRVLREQNHRCVYCRRILKVIDYHHKNGNRSDNRENNCQALCPNCHAIRTRKKLIRN